MGAPLLFAAADPAVPNGAHYGPARFGIVGPTAPARVPRRAQDAAAAARL